MTRYVHHRLQQSRCWVEWVEVHLLGRVVSLRSNPFEERHRRQHRRHHHYNVLWVQEAFITGHDRITK